MSAGSLYDLLGVDPRATHDEIRDAYRRLAKRHHPDAGEASAVASHMVDLNRAWSVLGDPQARLDYDRQLAESVATSHPAPRIQDTATPRRLLRALIAVAIVLVVVLAFVFTVVGFAQSPTS